MTSLLTNVAALSSLRALGATQLQLSRTQAQISSGLAIANASDGAAYWSIAQTMSAQVVGLRAVDQGLSMTMSIADVTTRALGSIKGSLDRIQADVVAAQQAGVSLSAIQSDISAQQQSIIAVANSASFNGVNWLIDQTSVNQKTTGYSRADVSDIDDELIRSAQLHDIEHFSSGSTTVTTTEDRVGNVTSQTSTSVIHGTIDGTGNYPVVTSIQDSGSVNSNSTPIANSYVIIPVSMSSTSGIITNSFSLSPLNLFTDNTGTVTADLTYYYTNKNVVEPETSSTAITHSYDADGATSSAGILDRNIPISGQAGQTILNLDITRASMADFTLIGQAVQTAISGIMIASTTIGSLQTQISNQRTFNSALADSLTSGIGSLVDADMNVASTRLQALQTQQQLGIQALSIANQDGQLLLKLFEAA